MVPEQDRDEADIHWPFCKAFVALVYLKGDGIFFVPHHGGVVG